MRSETSGSGLRRGVLAVVLTLLTLIAHAAAAGSLPSGTAILGGAIVAGAIAWSLAGRRRSPMSLMLILFAGQLLIHAVVVALGHHGVSYLPDASMTLAHLGAAGLAAVLFVRGEQIVGVWARAASRLLGVRQLSIVDIPTRGLLRTNYRVHVVDVVDGSPLVRRGPPNRQGALTFA